MGVEGPSRALLTRAGRVFSASDGGAGAPVSLAATPAGAGCSLSVGVASRSARARMLRAALRSRSMSRSHASHWYVRSERESLAFTIPHPEQVLLVAA